MTKFRRIGQLTYLSKEAKGGLPKIVAPNIATFILLAEANTKVPNRPLYHEKNYRTGLANLRTNGTNESRADDNPFSTDLVTCADPR